MQIFVNVLGGGTITLDVEPDFRVKEVKEMVAFMTKVDTNHQSMFCSDKKLEDEMYLSDFPIKPLSTLSMKDRMLGGNSGFEPIDCIDVTSPYLFETCNFGTHGHGRSVNIWDTIDEGLNFRGTCKNPDCSASNRYVYVKKGFYPDFKGVCILNIEIFEMNCPVCNVYLGDRDISGILIYKCRLEIVGKVVGKEKFTYTVESRGHCFKRALSMCDNDKQEYNYLRLEVTRLTDPNPLDDPRALDAPI